MWHLSKPLLFGIISLVVGCSGSPKKLVVTKPSETAKVRILSSDIESLVEQEKYQEAHNLAETYLSVYGVTPQTQKVKYLRAQSLEGLTLYEEALEGYREITRTAGTSKDIIANSLYRMSYCYEALGHDDKLVASLLDTVRRKVDLDLEISSAEIPARIAAGYSRLGNKKLSEKYFGLADAGIRSLKARGTSKKMESWLPKTLYYMGTVNVGTFKAEDFAGTLKPLEKSQGFLLEAATYGHEKWSPKAVDEIKLIYTNLIDIISKVVPLANNDGDIAEKEAQEKRWEYAALTLEVLEKLKSESRGLRESASAESDEIASFIESKEKELNRIIAENPTYKGLTPEALKRKRNIRKMKIVNPDPSLEETTIRNR